MVESEQHVLDKPLHVKASVPTKNVVGEKVSENRDLLYGQLFCETVAFANRVCKLKFVVRRRLGDIFSMTYLAQTATLTFFLASRLTHSKLFS